MTGKGIYRAQYLSILGYPDQAVAAGDPKDEHARRRNHPFDLAFALTLGAQAFDFQCEPDELLRRTEEGEQVGREHGVALMWEVMAESAGALSGCAAGVSATASRAWRKQSSESRRPAIASGIRLESAAGRRCRVDRRPAAPNAH